MTTPQVTLSVVSHGQNALANQLLEDIERHCGKTVALVLTQNVTDPLPLATSRLSSRHEVIVNGKPKGYGANQNAAFARCRTPFFCVANPDIRLRSNPFPVLLKTLKNERAGAAGPLVRSTADTVEDSARRFPTAGILLKKLFTSQRGPDYPVDKGPVEVDWIAGMFMLFRSDAFRAVSGFDEAYFLYYEDVDLCRRLRKIGKSVIYNPAAEVIHDARRASRGNPRLALHHLASIFRYFSRS
jgi:N-acetylglucosaminyl-diphospho-decaprenol L-rhamnosyltransferase